MPYKFLPDVAVADVAFEVSSPSINGLFEDSAKALTDVMVDRGTIASKITKQLDVKADTLDRLLYDFLTELIVTKDVDSLLFKDFRVELSPEGGSLHCTMKGEPIDRSRHSLRNDVKAVTMHMFGVERTDSQWRATIVLDI